MGTTQGRRTRPDRALGAPEDLEGPWYPSRVNADEEARRRSEALVKAGLVLSSELSLSSVLQKIIELACEVADARYGALGVLNDEGTIGDFLTQGVTEAERRAIGHLPEGHGILGALIHDARPLRLDRISDDPRSAGFPPNHPPMSSFLGVPIKIGDRVFGNLYLTEKRGAARFTDDDQQAVVTLATQAAIAIENASLFEEARLQERRLSAAAEVTRAILEGHDTGEVLRLVARRARELVGAALATIATPGGDDTLTLTVVDGEGADTLTGERFPIEGSISGEVMETGKPALISDAATDERVNQPIVRLGNIGPTLLVPLAAGDRPFGTLAVANLAGGRTFSDQDLTLVAHFADQASVAVDFARVRAELERLAILEDRERIAKELHDGVVQSLFAVGMSLQAAETATEDAGLRDRLAGAVDDIDRAIRELRGYIFGLRPGEAADRTLPRALEEMVADFSRGDRATIRLEVDRDLAPALATRSQDIIQAAREALSNAVRHAGATTITVHLIREDDEAVLTITDDGVGFDPAGVDPGGHGLGNLRARADALGGSVRFDPREEGGTRVVLRFPL